MHTVLDPGQTWCPKNRYCLFAIHYCLNVLEETKVSSIFGCTQCWWICEQVIFREKHSWWEVSLFTPLIVFLGPSLPLCIIWIQLQLMVALFHLFFFSLRSNSAYSLWMDIVVRQWSLYTTLHTLCSFLPVFISLTYRIIVNIRSIGYPLWFHKLFCLKNKSIFFKLCLYKHCAE